MDKDVEVLVRHRDFLQACVARMEAGQMRWVDEEAGDVTLAMIEKHREMLARAERTLATATS